VKRVYCGHSHFGVSATVDGLRATNIGSSYRWKTFDAVDFND
jgi:hypothetical protein